MKFNETEMTQSLYCVLAKSMRHVEFTCSWTGDADGKSQDQDREERNASRSIDRENPNDSRAASGTAS